MDANQGTGQKKYDEQESKESWREGRQPREEVVVEVGGHLRAYTVFLASFLGKTYRKMTETLRKHNSWACNREG